MNDLQNEFFGYSCKGETTRALAWAILAESALLNDRLHQDIQRIAQQKGAPMVPDQALRYYAPNPGPTEREIFNEYVRQRWPIHVFALDPAVQEQNVSDAFARRRETQLAMAVAFANGVIGANDYARFTRRQDFELETVSLNRTVVGFAHGNDTFGWRMYPRVQVPPSPSNLRVCVQNLFHGAPTRDDDLKKRQIEPGPRELMAIVVMPSFVPYLRMHVKSNWFCLTSPKTKGFSTEESVRLGQMMQYVRMCKAQCLGYSEMYRPGDISRVMNAVDTLEERLPMQDFLVQIPFENTLGGFRLFADGSRNLGPELIGFYGEPGVNTEADTNLFLVGRGFNVNVTEVVIGGQRCDDFTLLSRGVMRVKIPKGAKTTTVDQYIDGSKVNVKVVDAHVGTPYGVSSHLHIPVIAEKATSDAFKFDPLEAFGCIEYAGCEAVNARITATEVAVTGDAKYKGKVADVKISVKAVLADGRERDLTHTVNKAKKDVEEKQLALPSKVIDAKGKVTFTPAEFNQALGQFVGQKSPLNSHEGAIALKVGGTIKVAGNDEKPLSGTLLIKVTCQPAACPCPQAVPWPCPSTCCPTVSATSSSKPASLTAPRMACAPLRRSTDDLIDERSGVRPVTPRWGRQLFERSPSPLLENSEAKAIQQVGFDRESVGSR